MTLPVDQTTRIVPGDLSAAAQRTLSRLRKSFPGAFREVKPLKVGITHDIIAHTGMAELEVLHFLSFYTCSIAYLRAQAQPGALRYDLDGQPICAVTHLNRDYAAERLAQVLAERDRRARYLAFRITEEDE